MAKWIYRWQPIDLTWRHIPGSLRQRVGTRGSCLRVLDSGMGVSAEGHQFLVLVHPRFIRQRSSPRLTHESSDESESICGPYWAPEPANSGGIPSTTLEHIDDVVASRESPVRAGSPFTPQSS